MLGRLLLFSLLWLSAYQIAKQLAPLASPLILVAIFLVNPMVVELLRFPSDPLFISMAAFSFWQLLRYHDRQSKGHLWAASLFMGLAALARNDGLVLFPILVVSSALATTPLKRWYTSLVPSVVPFLALVGGYVLFFGWMTGTYELGTLRRTYINFEAGHQVIYAGTGELSPVIEARLEARRVFGTPDENNYSVIEAIQRNPQVYLQRVVALTRELPRKLLRAYGIRFAALLALLALRGVWELLERRHFRLTAIFLLWPAHLVTGFIITLFRDGHLQFPYYIVFALASIGLGALLANLRDRRERTLWYLLLLGLVVYGVAANKLAIYYGAAIFLIALWIIWTVGSRYRLIQLAAPTTLLILFAAGLIIRGNFPSPKVPTLGREAKEQAAVYMLEHLEPGTKVAAGSPGVVWSAGMTYAGLTATDVPRDKSSLEFLDWMIRQEIQAIYVDHTLYNSSPALWNLIKEQIGSGVERVFSGDDGDIQVLIILP